MKLDETSMNLLEEWAFAEYLRVRVDGKADHHDAALAAAEAAADQFELTDDDMYEIYDRLFAASEDWSECELDIVRGWRTDNYEMDQTEWLDHFFSSEASDDQRMLLIKASFNTQAAAEAKLAALGK